MPFLREKEMVLQSLDIREVYSLNLMSRSNRLDSKEACTVEATVGEPQVTRAGTKNSKTMIERINKEDVIFTGKERIE
ncbi:hypothetical protein HPP92_016319 [Vanilla planifolia]|uniref:Uncharacterized protein n=1 Tax=Vanilla planifolia TaxID=51239 RepID=A0A835URZ4_VANPL|nr:hypothetical protein HPP92_016319 [Vanilla planifolia]